MEETDHGTQNRITVCPGANFAITIKDVSWIKDEIQDYDMVILQFELPMPVVEAVAQWAYDASVPVMINPAPAAPISDELLQCTTYLSPNEHEAAILANHPIHTENGICFEDVEAVATVFRARGVKNLIITMGENGAIVAGQDGLHHTPCVKMPLVIDPTAAGDSFVGAFCTGVSAGLPQEQALAFASHAAAITVSRMGAITSLPSLDDVQALMQERNYKTI